MNTKQFSIRRALPEDALGIHLAHMESIQKVCSSDHSPEEIRVWGHRPFREEQRLNAIRNHIVYVVVINDAIEGYGHLKIDNQNAHLLGLYLTPKALGKGIGTSLFLSLLDEAKKNNVGTISLESTITAKAFYLKNQFEVAGEMTTILLDNQPIRCIPMVMKV